MVQLQIATFVFTLGMIVWYWITIGINLVDLLTRLVTTWMDDFLLEVGAAGYANVIAYPLVTNLGAAAVAAGVASGLTNWSEPGPDKGAAIAIVGLIAIVAVPVILQRLMLRKEGLALSVRIYALRNQTFEETERDSVLLKLSQGTQRAQEQRAKTGGRAFASQMVCSAVLLAVSLLPNLLGPTRDLLTYSSELWLVGLFLGALLTRKFVRPWNWGKQVKRLEYYRTTVKAIKPVVKEMPEVHHHHHGVNSGGLAIAAALGASAAWFGTRLLTSRTRGDD